MTRYSFHPLILCVLGLSIIGLFYRLYTEPVALFQQALFMIVFVAIIFFLVKKFLAHKLSSGNYYSSQPQPKRVKVSSKSNVIPHKKKKETKNFPVLLLRSVRTLH
ncbi:hypothetical protein H1D32_13605 [Anaerobacillus sp. CMMVII]|uniref:SA1362 family protein n=1 Tax=Anaerobacillus sp. CMMVII TaxID=2755588 RepID=UPI0021B821A8|nr:hypothetical protein [Anaerobacillus sp. CMMVII]